ncbi:MAG: HAD family hydrolase [Anaerolineae bacterium]|nr:HAD family hydrolase [Phycisphaerae bacterium]
MPRPAIFFDRDNTLIACDDYLGDPEQVKLIDGAADAIARARTLGFAIVVFSNQSGVARGMFGEDDVQAVNERLDQLLVSQNAQAIIDRHEYCPFHPDATVESYRQDSDRRKPGAGMIHSAADALGIDLPNSWVIGDAPRDIEAGVAAGCHTILFCDPNLSRSPAADATVRVKPDHTVNSLAQAIDVIEGDDDEHTPFAQKPAATLREKEKSDPDASSTTKSSSSRLETLAEQILYELRRSKEQPHTDFSVAKLLAGISQVISIALVFLAYLNRNETTTFGALLLFAVWVQCFTITLLIMGKQN